MNNTPGKKYKVKLFELTMEFRTVEVSDMTLSRHQNKIESIPALYPFHKVSCLQILFSHVHFYEVLLILLGESDPSNNSNEYTRLYN